ncbi:MAG: hypothetical protein A2026_21870 [Deltaproteobacteria bacterium RBG_19FT_COMBO_46_12]|nr:MAG: hypothetical protein A2026_21870 [Deltaproteobacteria bacterium RBG_19FT_COMBO_46_12]
METLTQLLQLTWISGTKRNLEVISIWNEGLHDYILNAIIRRIVKLKNNPPFYLTQKVFFFILLPVPEW